MTEYRVIKSDAMWGEFESGWRQVWTKRSRRRADACPGWAGMDLIDDEACRVDEDELEFGSPSSRISGVEEVTLLPVVE